MLVRPRFFLIVLNAVCVKSTEVGTISAKDNKKTQINEEIRASEVRLIDEEGEMRGIYEH